MLGQAQVLQEGVSDARHQRVPVQSCPGAPLEVTETAEERLALRGHFEIRRPEAPSAMWALNGRDEVGP